LVFRSIGGAAATPEPWAAKAKRHIFFKNPMLTIG
jgi:hypothetical protein